MTRRGVPTTVRQVELEQVYSTGAVARITCWLDADPRVKIGVRVTLKDGPDGYWKVVKVHRTMRESDKIKRDWRVGGLF